MADQIAPRLAGDSVELGPGQHVGERNRAGTGEAGDALALQRDIGVPEQLERFVEFGCVLERGRELARLGETPPEEV